MWYASVPFTVNYLYLWFTVTKSNQVCFQQLDSAAVIVCPFPWQVAPGQLRRPCSTDLCTPNELHYRALYSLELRCVYLEDRELLCASAFPAVDLIWFPPQSLQSVSRTWMDSRGRIIRPIFLFTHEVHMTTRNVHNGAENATYLCFHQIC